MSSLLLFVVLLSVPSTMVKAVLFDLSNGDSSGLAYPCLEGPSGNWAFEQASMYEGGPTEGTVLTSSKSNSACLSTIDVVPVTANSKFYIHVRVPYKNSWDKMQLWLVSTKDNRYYEWEPSINGPVAIGEEWMELTRNLPADIDLREEYKVEIFDGASSAGVSIRYFEITDEPRTTTTTTMPSTEPETTVTELETSITEEETTTEEDTTIEEETTTPEDTTTEEETTFTELETTITEEETTFTELETTITEEETTISTDSVTEITTTEEDITTGEQTTEQDDSTEPESSTVSLTMEATTQHDVTSTTDIDSTTVALNTQPESTTAEALSEGSTQTWTSTMPPPPPPPPGGFVLNGWSVVVGVAIGVLLMTSLFCLGTCCWWVVCVKWRRDAEPQQDLTLPRLEVVSSSGSSGVSITGRSSKRQEAWRSSNWIYQG